MTGHADCGTAGARTLAASASGRAYVTGQIVLGCSAHGSGSFRLGTLGRGCLAGGHLQLPIVVAGEFAAYTLERCLVDTGMTLVMVRRLSDGKLIASQPAITNAIAVESFKSVPSLVLKSDGAVAWLAVLESFGRTRSIEVHRLDRRGAALLDSGIAIRPAALQLSGSTVSWQHSGSSRSAALN